MREDQTKTAGFLACHGMLHNYLAAARGDQFLVEQDPHETAAPATACYGIAITMPSNSP